MGQAKRRGTFEERRAQAVAKEVAESLKKQAIAHGIRPRGKSNLGLMVTAALAAAAFK